MSFVIKPMQAAAVPTRREVKNPSFCISILFHSILFTQKLMNVSSKKGKKFWE